MSNFTTIMPPYRGFLEPLGYIEPSPRVLFVKGKLPERRLKTVAIVGSRHNTRYGEEIAYRLAYELARHGVVVVSGLAYGIDSIGHQGCLDAGGTTVAVLGTPIDTIHPAAHIQLAREIVKTGAIISEYPPATTPVAADDRAEFATDCVPLAPGEFIAANGRRAVQYKASFLHRNRLISGLSDVVVVVEAAEKSGSLNTATHALSQGKDVFAVPGNITSPYSQGCNKLIRQGALPYTEPDDVLRLLFPKDYAISHRNSPKNLLGDTDVETAILKSIAAGHRTGTDIMVAAKLPPEIFGEFIAILEIKGRVISLGANAWSLCP